MLASVLKELKELYHGVGEDGPFYYVHGLGHAERVLQHCQRALENSYGIPKLDIYLAAVLHDANDEKVFGPGAKNVQKILARHLQCSGRISRILEMVDLVSYSKNGIGRGRPSPSSAFNFVPRDADRLEALGYVGIARCIAYGLSRGRSLFNSCTPRPKTRDEVFQTSFRMMFYGKGDELIRRPEPLSEAETKTLPIIDYFIGYLVPRSIMSSGLPYFEEEGQRALNPLINFLVFYGTFKYPKHFSVAHVSYFVRDDPIAVEILKHQ